MADVSVADIKKLRELTGAGMSDVKKALVDHGGDMDKATAYLREKGLAGVAKRGVRTAENGLVHAYLHRTARDLPPTVGVLVEVNCETDFVAKNEAFQELARELALHIASTDPLYLTKEDVPNEVIDRLADALDKSLDDPAVQKRVAALGMTIPDKAELTPQALHDFHKAELDKWWPIIKSYGIKVN